MATTLKRTPLYEEHKRLNGKMVPFAGYEMPVQYPAGILAEHQAVRERAGMFDVSHMGELEVRGGDALGFVQYVTTNDASKLEVGQAQYSAFCGNDGSVLDDCIVYRFDDHYMLVVNASNVDKDRDWITPHAARFETQVIDRSEETGLIALQGPRAQEILARITDADLDSIRYYHFGQGDVAGVPAVISRTGYTGEDGFELYLPADRTEHVWQELMSAGQQNGIVPAGLGARDSLRLEAGLPLYGHDLTAETDPVSAGLGFAIGKARREPGGFPGADKISRLLDEGAPTRRVGLALEGRAAAREGAEVFAGGDKAGTVTSGGFSPTLGHPIAMAFVDATHASDGTELEIEVRGKRLPARVVPMPFVPHRYHRKGAA